MNKINYHHVIASLTGFLVLIILILFLLYYFSIQDITPSPKLVIDHDGGADDAMAIFLALLNEKHFDGYQVVALTTSHGNVDESQVFNNTQKFLNIANRKDIAIFRGSSYSLVQDYLKDFYYGMDGLGDSSEFSEFEPIEAQPDHAAIALIKMSKRFEGELIVVALGALTNIAMALRLDPGFISRLQHLYIAGSNIYSENFKKPEFNALVDVESYHIVLEKSHPDIVTVIPFSQIYLSHNISKEWRNLTLGSIQTEMMRALNAFEQKSLAREETWTQLDPVAMAIALNGSRIIEDLRLVHNSIDICENRGINSNNFTSETFNTRIVYKLKQEPYMDMLLEIFSADFN